MASRILLRPTTAALFTTSIVAAPLLLHPNLNGKLLRPHLCDAITNSNVAAKDWSFTQYTEDARTPIVTKDGKFNGRALRQVSAG
ncbi:hypothetical protein LTS18_009103, partial [Coniosporium uncinatum]